MAIDLEALVALQKRRTKRAQDALAAAEAIRREAERAALEAVTEFETLKSSHASRRDGRIREIIGAPTSVVSLARIRLQYDVGEDEMAAKLRDVKELRAKSIRAAKKVEEAKLNVNACLKREMKLEEAASRVAKGLAQRADVEAEMELEG
jgi:hypothetical protein